jgi:hypothetical protein
MSDYGVKIGIKADTGIMLMKPSTVSAVVTPLEVRRIRYRLVFFYKVIHHLVAIPYS